jgi:uroporphyrinogen-III synthase
VVAPLIGFTVGITGHRRWEEQAEMLVRRGAQVVHAPVVRTMPLDDVDATIRATHEILASPVDIVVLTTGIGTRSWLGVAESAGVDGALRESCRQATVLARGPKARSAAIGGGLEVTWQAPEETSVEIRRRLAETGVAGKRVAVQLDGGGSDLADRIRSLGADVVEIPVYRWQLPDDEQPVARLVEATVAGRVDAVTFTSSIAVDNLFALAADEDALARALGASARAIAVGPVTAAALRRHGVDRIVEPRRARLGAMVQALVAELTALHRMLRLGDVAVRWQGSAIVGPDETVTVLTPGEARVLDALLVRSPAVVPKADLVDDGVDEHAAEAAVARLRTKLGPLGHGIRTVPRRGYACELTVA